MRREENGGMGKNAGESLKGECWRIERGTMRGDEERALARREGDREMEAVTAVEGKYEGMLGQRGGGRSARRETAVERRRRMRIDEDGVTLPYQG